MGTEVLSRFADAGADALYILTGQRSAPPAAQDPREAALLDNYRHCDERGRAAVDGCCAALAQPEEIACNPAKKGAA